MRMRDQYTCTTRMTEEGEMRNKHSSDWSEYMRRTNTHALITQIGELRAPVVEIDISSVSWCCKGKESFFSDAAAELNSRK